MTGEGELERNAPPGATPRGLVVHAVLLWVGMLLLMPLVGVHRSPLISDEGALLMQVETLERYGGWAAPYPLADLDPEGEFIGLGDTQHVGGEIVVYTSRPAYIYLNLAAHHLGGIWGITAVGTAFTALTAWFCAMATREIDPRSAVLCLWLIGLGTPLLFHGYVLHGHPVGAAGAAAALWLALRSSRALRPWWLHLAAGVALMAGATVRRELAAMSLGFIAWSALDWQRSRKISALSLGACASIGTVVGLALDRFLLAWVLGDLALPHVPVITSETDPLVLGRIQSAYDSTLLTTFDDPSLLDFTMLLAGALGLVGAMRLRRNGEVSLLVTGLVVGALAAILRLISPGVMPPLVPGLVITAPVLFCGLFLLPLDMRRSTPVRYLVAASGVAVVGVLATQYQLGWGWGGRFLAVTLPSLAVLSALGWTAMLEPRANHHWRALRLAAAGSVIALAVLAVGAQRDGRLSAERLRAEIVSATDDSTIVATPERWLARYDTAQLTGGGARWSLPGERGFPDLLEHLAQQGVTRVLVPSYEGRDVAELIGDSDWNLVGGTPLPRLRIPLTLWELSR